MNKVKQTCEILGITQKELAEKMGVALQTIRNWSANGNIPEWGEKYMDTLIQIKTKEKKMAEQKSKKLQITFNIEMIEKMEEIAKSLGMNLNQYIVYAVAKDIDSRNQKRV